MDQLLGKIAAQSVSFAIKSGITVVSSYAIKEGSRYIRSIKGRDREELERLQDRLETKIRIISPAIDLVEIIAARGNTSLETAVALTKSLRYDIQALGQRLAEENLQSGPRRRRRTKEDVKAVMDDIKAMLDRIEDAVPLINLAVTTSGVNLSASIPHTVSPSRLLQASTLLTAGDTAYSMSPFYPAQIGMAFNLTLYMLFAGHSHRKDITANDLTWQEVISKGRVKLVRVPLVFDEEDADEATHTIRAQHKVDEYCYELCVIEDLDDGRAHESEGSPFEDVQQAGIRFRIPIHQISKIFYTNSGKLLGIDEASSPILLIKRDLGATPPRKLLDRASRYDYESDEGDDEDAGYSLDGGEGNDNEPSAEEGEWDLPKHLDQEWFAFEVWTEPQDDDQSVDEESDTETQAEERNSGSKYGPVEGVNMHPLATNFSELTIHSPGALRPDVSSRSLVSALPSTSVTVKSNLSLLECLLRLASLQNYQQASHLAVHDELLNLFLSDASSWLGSQESRERERENARKRIGFDPFGSPTSGGAGEDASSIPGTPKSERHVELDASAEQLRNTSPSSTTPLITAPRGHRMISSTPKAQPARSQSPGEQLLFESANERSEAAVTRSYPNTPQSQYLGRQINQGPSSTSKVPGRRLEYSASTSASKEVTNARGQDRGEMGEVKSIGGAAYSSRMTQYRGTHGTRENSRPF